MNLQDLFISKVNALYDIELQLVKALPKMAKASADAGLKKGFLDHLEETKTHVARLEEIHKMLGVKPKKLKSEAIRGLVEDGSWVITHVKPKEARDANLARAAQYVEHYEMAGYSAAIAWAEDLGEDKIAQILRKTLEEEIEADIKLDIAGAKLDKKII